MPITFSSLVTSNVRELEGSPKEDFSFEKFSAVVTLECPWATRFTLIEEILFSLQMYPHFPTIGARATSIGCIPRNAAVLIGDGQGATYDMAEVSITYETLDAKGDGEDPEVFTIIEDRVEPNSEFQTLDYTDFRWDNNAGALLKPDEAPGKLIRGFNYVQRVLNVTSVHADHVDLVDSVNSGPHTSETLGVTFAAQTLLYSNPTISRTFKSDGSSIYTIEKTFAYRKNGWNKFFRASSQAYESIYVTGGAAHENFPPESFSNILV